MQDANLKSMENAPVSQAILKLSGLMYAQPIADFLTTATAVLIGIPLLRDLPKTQKTTAAEAGSLPQRKEENR